MELRKFLIKAIRLSMEENSSEFDVNGVLVLEEKKADLQLGCQRYIAEKHKLKIGMSDQLLEKTKGYNTTEIGVLVYFICDNMGIYMRNDDTKNCEQKVAIPPVAKAFGYSESSFTDRLNPDFTESATRKAMVKVATDFKYFMPEVSKEIMRQYEDYEEDFSEKQRKKRKNSAR